MNGVLHSPNAPPHYVLASLISTFENPKPSSAELKHLRHKGQILEAAVFVQCCKDFLLASDLSPLSGFQVESTTSGRIPLPFTLCLCLPRLVRALDNLPCQFPELD